MARRMNSSNNGTVNAVSPWFGLQIIPLAINPEAVKTGRSSQFGMPELEAAGRRVTRKTTLCALLTFDPVLEADTLMLFGMEF
jgi:hypothetical protein